jgi:hypothetical protein
MNGERLRRWSLSNWFLIVAPVLLGVAWFVSRSAVATPDGHGLEPALIFDACVTLPVLYALCYGRRLSVLALTLRMVGIACLAIYLLSFIVPADQQRLLPAFGWARIAGLTLLCLIELRLVAGAVRMVFRSDVTAVELAVKTGAPPFVAKLMVMEARFWKAVWRLFRRQ